jgi:hypothetical protein
MVERPGLGKRPSSNGRGVSPPPSKRKQQSTTTSTVRDSPCREMLLTGITGKAVASFFTPLSKKEPEKMSWRIVKDSLLVGRYATSAGRPAAKDKTKIAAFDLVRLHTKALYECTLTDDNVGLNANHFRFWKGIQSWCNGLEVVAQQCTKHTQKASRRRVRSTHSICAYLKVHLLIW